MSNQVRMRLIATTLLGMVLAAYGMYSGMWPLAVLGIMLVPLSFLRS